MQQKEYIRNRLRRIAAATIALLFFVPATAWAYSTSQSYYSTRSSYSKGYYSTKYGWVGPSPRYVVPTPTPAPVPIPSPPLFLSRPRPGS